jgi:hypothetical protein
MGDSAVHSIDVRNRPVGSAYGGSCGVSVECPVCHKPALVSRRGKTKGEPWTQYAHVVSFSLRNSEPVLTWGAICTRATVRVTAKRSVRSAAEGA